MMNLRHDLTSIMENGIGYFGGAAVDTHKGLDLNECMTMTTSFCYTDQMASDTACAKQANALCEAVMSGAGMDTLLEASLDGFMGKVKEFFTKILDFFKSIIAKIKLQIDKQFKTGKQLWDKYKDHENIKKAQFKGLEVTGYDILKKDVETVLPASDAAAYVSTGFKGGKVKIDITQPATLVSTIGDVFEGETTTPTSDMQDTIDHWNERRDSEDIDVNKGLANDLVKVSLSGKDWQEDLKEELYGSKETKTLKFGDDFTLSAIDKLLTDPADLDKVKTGYEKLAKKYEDIYKGLEKGIANAKREYDKGAGKDNSTNRAALNLLVGIADIQITILRRNTAFINTVQQIKTKFIKDQQALAKKTFGKMLSYKQPKNEAAEIEFDVDFGFDF